MWPSRRRQRRNDHNHNNNDTRSWSRNSNVAAAPVVGTEAKAIDNIAKNSKTFSYPKEGFISRIEHSLTYNMISEPDVYPEDVVLNIPTNFKVHTITFGSGADQTRMADLAAMRNGQHFHAPDNATLIDIFRDIAATLPVVMTK